ncbi:MAG: L-lactate dehydrogenase, partial [Clostridiales bacterium]|nr:L-lactate dehydrogenase [Clostridiales bacterium]
METKSKIAIIGLGYVGSSTAYTLALHQAANEIVLIDIDKDKASGEAADIKSALCFVGGTNIYAGDYEDIKDCSIIIVTAGMGRKPGETRLDLAKKNVAVMKDITENIKKYYNKGVIVVVSNPVDILTYMIRQWTGLPSSMVIG